MSALAVELGGQGDNVEIRRLLERAVATLVQNEGSNVPEDVRQALHALSGNVEQTLRPAVNVRGEDHPAKSPLSALRSPLLRPPSPPPVDEEVRGLEQQVDESSQRVAALRASMQSRLQERIADQLARARPVSPLAEEEPASVAAAVVAAPAAETAGGEAGADAAAALTTAAAPAGSAEAEPMSIADDDTGSAAEQAEPASPRTQELQQRLAAAAAKLPALRARLEEASGRLQRVMGVAAGQLDAPPPNTVEKAVLGKTPGPPAAPATGSPGRDLAPLPLSAPLEDEL